MTITDEDRAIDDKKVPTFDQWAIVELYGHVRLAGRVTEEEVFGKILGRIDVPTGDDADAFVTQYFGGGSIYRLTPCSEEAARQAARTARPTPIYRLELTAAPERPAYDEPYADVDDVDDDGWEPF